MKIYNVNTDSNNVQGLIPNVNEDILLDVLSFDCISKENQLDNITWYIHNPKNKKGNFYIGVNGALVFDQAVYDSELFTLFEIAGEILPIHLESGEDLYALNILECVNMLNEAKTTFDLYDDGSRGRILKHAFYKDRISESSIFKIPETSRVEILTYTDVHDKDDEFFYLYKSLNFTGLKFEELY
jgi:hypothetical protein